MPKVENEKLSFKLISKKAIIPSIKEIENNPPSRSAKLRAIKRCSLNKIDTDFLYKKFKVLLDIEIISKNMNKLYSIFNNYFNNFYINNKNIHKGVRKQNF